VKEINLAFLFPNLYEAIKLEKEANFLNKKEGKKMTKMTRPVMKHLAEINLKNWDKLDEAIKIVSERLIKEDMHYTLCLETEMLLNQIRDNIKFIDETFRVWLEED